MSPLLLEHSDACPFLSRSFRLSVCFLLLGERRMTYFTLVRSARTVAYAFRENGRQAFVIILRICYYYSSIFMRRKQVCQSKRTQKQLDVTVCCTAPVWILAPNACKLPNRPTAAHGLTMPFVLTSCFCSSRPIQEVLRLHPSMRIVKILWARSKAIHIFSLDANSIVSPRIHVQIVSLAWLGFIVACAKEQQTQLIL